MVTDDVPIQFQKKVRQTLLVGQAREKEEKIDNLKPLERQQVLKAMESEWNVYQEFRATQTITQKELANIMAKNPKAQIIDTRWVITRKPPPKHFKARLVAIGCQEPKSAMRTDSPTGSLSMVWVALAYGGQKGWRLSGYDAKSAYLQVHDDGRILLLRLPKKCPPPGCVAEQVVVGKGAIYGTRDAGRRFYIYAKGVWENTASWNSPWRRLATC